MLLKNEGILQRDVVLYITRKDDHSNFKVGFEDDMSRYERELASEHSKFQTDLSKTNNSIQIFRKELTSSRPDLLQHVKQIMESIESQIKAIKSYQKSVYDSLITTETALSAELSIFDKELYKYEKNIPRGSVSYKAVKGKSQSKRQDGLHPAVVEFDQYVATHGPANKWGEFEQQLFLSLFVSHLEDDAMVEKMSQVLPFKSAEQITSQIAWYRRYLKLETAKRDALREWRENKRKPGGTKPTPPLNMTLDKIGEKKRELFEKERQERLAHLSAYKVQKELARVQAEEERLRKELSVNEKEERRRDLAARQREKVQAFKEKKQKEEEERRAREREEVKHQKSLRTVSSSDLLRLHQSNMKLVEKKQQREQEKIVAEFEQRERLERLKPRIEAKSDPGRLLQKTKGQINREKDRSSTVNPTVGSRGMPSRAVPSWRAGL